MRLQNLQDKINTALYLSTLSAGVAFVFVQW